MSLPWVLWGVRVVLFFGVLTTIVGNGALYVAQHNRLPLYSKVGEINLSRKTVAEARDILNAHHAKQRLNLVLPNRQIATPLDQAGVRIDSDAVIAELTNSRGLNSLPLAKAWHARSHSVELRYQTDKDKLQTYLKTLQLPASTPAVNATISINSDIAVINPAKPGIVYDQQSISQTVLSAVSQAQLTITLQPKQVSAAVQASDLTDSLAATNRLLQSRLIIENDSGTYRFSPENTKRVVTIQTDSNGKSSPFIEQAQLREVLTTATASFYLAASPGRSTYVDGELTAEQAGVNGRTLDVEAAMPIVQAALLDNKERVTVPLVKLTAQQAVDRSYTPTTKGLNALIAYFAATHRGTFKVASTELNGNRSASFHANDAIVPASTYKLFVAYVTLKKIEQGSLTFETHVGPGTVDFCLNKMILISDNTCAGALLNKLTVAEANSYIHAAGFTRTSLDTSSSDYMTTTAQELNNFLIALNSQQLLSAGNTNYLLNLMQHQIYRSGIPAAINGTVANKVGFLFSWSHDVALVHTPQADYSLVIMTTNSSFSTIKELAAQINALYSQPAR